MIEIKDLLGRFSNILLVGGEQKETIRRVISEVTGIDIHSEDIQIKNNIIYLNTKPIYKNEIFLKQDKIFSVLAEALGAKPQKDIREIR